MAPLLLSIFVLSLAIYVINTVGAAQINELAWLLSSKLPTPTARRAQEAGKQKREVVRLKREMNGVSPQDQFSKWAKLQRQHDKALAEFEKSQTALKSTRASFDTTITTLRWVSTTGLRFFIQFWFSRQALFWLPQGWVPGYVEWILSFPRAPKGSISVQVWQLACTSVITMVAEALGALYVLATKKAADQKSVKGKPQAVPAAADQKKEL